ncbi:SpoIIE family protein phosphatase [Pokkaliibacter sp. CJK22405]|uniref:SpoIIE family protein phosphatase n=1 Tax=Pokkaliibacter sp. CJK22405 TaxID=3384615 RepID=UPI0039849EED
MSDADVLLVAGRYLATEQIAEYLEKQNLRVIWADKPGEVREIMSAQSFKVVLCSLNLKQGVGLDVLRYLVETFPSLPVIMMAQSAILQDVLNALRSGACDFFIQPQYDLPSLFRSIKKNVRKYRALVDNEAYKAALEENNIQLQLSLKELENDQKAGRHVQQRMFPAADLDSNGFHFSHQLIPSLYLSGDFIDYIPLNLQLTIFYLADISGHGASSAFVTVLLKNLSARFIKNYKKYGVEGPVSPLLMLKRINQELLDTPLGKHMTIFIGVLDTQSQVLRYSIGGHYPLPLVSQGDSIQFLSGGGMPVGLFPDPHFEEHELALNPDEPFSVTVFSDGILEVLEGRLQEKEQQLMDLVRDTNHDPQAISDALDLTAVELPDDIAILSVRKN